MGSKQALGTQEVFVPLMQQREGIWALRHLTVGLSLTVRPNYLR